MTPSNRYVSNPGREFATPAEAGGPEARALADRLTGSLDSAIGDLEIGIAARPQMNTGLGHPRNLLETDRPEEAGGTADARGRASYGQIIIHRS